ERVEIAPDGKRIALILTEGEERNIVVRELANDASGALRIGDKKVRDLEWAGAGHLIVSASTTTIPFRLFGPRSARSGLLTALSYDVQTREQRQLMENVVDAGNVLVGSPQIRIVGEQATTFLPAILFGAAGARVSLYKIDESAKVTSLVKMGFSDTRAWL